MLAAIVMAGLCFRKMMHSTLAICFISFFIDPRPVKLHTVFRRWFNPASWCRRGAVSCWCAQLSTSSDAETFPVF